MISGDDLYKVMCAMVPLYFAMLVAYGAVKWWNIFTPEQCSGINRFVAVFAVPVLSFHFISENNPYQMDTKFIFADTVSKLAVLALLTAWGTFLGGGLDWSITLFSVSTLPNTLVMGIPLLHAMYGHFTQSLMVQLVVLQCIIWYTLLLFLYEYRAATELIRTQFPGTAAASISKFEIDGDVMSLDGRDTLRADSEMDGNGRIRVRIRRSTSSASALDQGLSSAVGLTPRPSNLSGAEIFSVTTPVAEFGTGEFPAMGYRTAMSPPFSVGGYASSEAYSQQPTPRASNFTEMEATAAAASVMGAVSPLGGKVCRQQSPAFPGRRQLWDRLSPLRKGRRGGEEMQGLKDDVVAEKELSFRQGSPLPDDHQEVGTRNTSTNQAMPRAIVMLRLILIVVGRKLSRNPNTYSSILGLTWSLVSFRWDVAMPRLLKSSIKIISDAGLGMAMFSLGLFMALQPRLIACGTKRAMVVMAIRFLGGPALMSAASVAVGLRGVHLHTAIVQAALPQGIVPFVFAREYGLHPDILSTGVIFGMLISLPITLLYYILLGL